MKKYTKYGLIALGLIGISTAGWYAFYLSVKAIAAR